MKNGQRGNYETREAILKLLANDEVASVSTAETAARLLDGDEYLDLEHLHQGVQRAFRTTIPMGRVLPKMAVHERTWNKIVAQLAAPLRTAQHAGR